MIEENKPVEETSTPSAESPELTSASTGEAVSELKEEAVPELVDEEMVEAVSAEPEATVDAAGAADDTDYEAAFMELRSSYAAKEREFEDMKAQADDRQSQYLRLAADFENYRRRTQREKEDLEAQIKCSTLVELLAVVDNFERARSQIKPDTDAEMNIHKSYQGVYKDFVDRLKKIGVSPMRAEGQPFDPNFHNAVMREPTADHPEGTVVEELMRGYVLGEKVLRHAMVKVAAPPEDEAPESAATDTAEATS
jgi:molecular chaperone GrpE